MPAIRKAMTSAYMKAQTPMKIQNRVRNCRPATAAPPKSL
jgi:hypothetical protein